MRDRTVGAERSHKLRKKRGGWRYEFDCARCDNIRELFDENGESMGDRCVVASERTSAGLCGPIHIDEAARCVRCDAFKRIPKL